MSGFMMKRRVGGLIISSKVSTSLLAISSAPQPHSQRNLMSQLLSFSGLCMNEFTSCELIHLLLQA